VTKLLGKPNSQARRSPHPRVPHSSASPRISRLSNFSMSSPEAPPTDAPVSTPSPFNYILSFLLVGICWGFTTPFIRRAAVNYTAPTNPSITDPSRSWLSRQIAKAFFTVVGLVKKPAYAIPLVANLTGSIWFFLLVGQAGKLQAFNRSEPHSEPSSPLWQPLYMSC
jgi:hypothetical protein